MIKTFSWHSILRAYQSSYYVVALLQIVTIIVIIKGITAKRQNRITRIISIYAIASLIQMNVQIITWGYNDLAISMLPIFSLSYFIFMFIEAICCYLVLSINLNAPLVKLLKILLLGFLIFGFIYLCIVPYQKWSFNIITLIELPLIIFFCSIYYYQLLTRPPQALLLQPHFWAISAMTLLAFCLIPFTLVYDYIMKNKSLIHLADFIPALSYIVCNILYIKALQCSQKQPVL